MCFTGKGHDGVRVQWTGLDLNLVLALRALLEERNVTRAGQRVGLSQPAMSAALSRLRRHFDDELLARTGNSYELTPLGAALLDRTVSACDLLERVFTSQTGFDPATERREFTLVTSDYGLSVFGVPLARVLHREAPEVRLRFEQTGVKTVESAAETLARVDGLLLPHGVITDFPAVELFQDTWVCLVAEDHPDVSGQISLADLARLPWAVYQRTHDAPVARQLSMLGIEPRVEVSVQSFQLLPALVEGTSRVALVQERLALQASQRHAVTVLPCPFEAVPVREAMWWHPMHTRDAGHAWFREVVQRVGRQVAG